MIGQGYGGGGDHGENCKLDQNFPCFDSQSYEQFKGYIFVKDQFGYISDIWAKQDKVCDVDRLGGFQNAYQQEKDALLTSKGTNS